MSFEEIVVGSIFVPKVELTQSITDVVRPGTPLTNSVIWVKNSCPKTPARMRATRMAPPPMIAVAVPLDRPRLMSQRIPGSSAIAKSQASTIRNRKWLSTEYSHNDSSSPADHTGSTDRRAVEAHVDVKAALRGRHHDVRQVFGARCVVRGVSRCRHG